MTINRLCAIDAFWYRALTAVDAKINTALYSSIVDELLAWFPVCGFYQTSLALVWLQVTFVQ